MTIKKMSFSGSWYPSAAIECEKQISDFLKTADYNMPKDKECFACISPHAGWYFSGSIACNVIKLLATDQAVDVVVLFGKHLHQYSPATVLTGCSLETPFGNLDIDEEFSAEIIQRLAIAKEDELMHGSDNTIELQLPFVKYFFPDSKIVVIGAPLSKLSIEIGKTVSRLASDAGKIIKIVGSTDMTHYGDNFGFSPAGFGPEAVEWVKDKNDQIMLDAMVAMEEERILALANKHRNACCGGAVAATVAAAKEAGVLGGVAVAYSSSYDLSPSNSFVGYGGVVY